MLPILIPAQLIFFYTDFLHLEILLYHGILQSSIETRSDRLMTQVWTLEYNFGILILNSSAFVPASLFLNFKKATISIFQELTPAHQDCAKI